MTPATLATLAQRAAALRREHPYYREGQAAFNALYDLHPFLADQIRSDHRLDPFYNDARLPAFWAWVAEQ